VPELASTLLPLLAIFLVFWLLIIRPQSRRTKALQQLRSTLQPGDRVMLTSGIYATLRSSDGDRATVEIAPGTVVEIATAAIASVDVADQRVDEPADDAEVTGDDPTDTDRAEER
jgi:preprotein translocase subunit YajC